MVLILVVAPACRPATEPSADDDTTSSGTSASTGPIETTFTTPDACTSSDECEGEPLRCVAPYDPGSDPPVGPGACIEVCIEADDLTRWCFDDAGCCGELRCNVVDGFCEPLGETEDGTSSGDETGTTGTTGTTGGSGSSSGGSSSGTEGSSSSSGTGGSSSSTGGGSGTGGSSGTDSTT
ncbi:MAG: hypothetical protein AAGF11_37110 [Myxococcota bacterium]